MILWLYGLAIGSGLTARALKNPFLARNIAPLAYPVYLCHYSIAWMWWYCTRGTDHEYWFPDMGAHPMPVDWYEMIAIIILSFAVSWVLTNYATAALMPATTRIVRCFFACVCCCCPCCPSYQITPDAGEDDNSDDDDSIK